MTYREQDGQVTLTMSREAAKILGISAATLMRIELGHAMDATTLLKIINWFLARRQP